MNIIEKTLLICLAVAIIGLIVAMVFAEEEKETVDCPKCGNKIKHTFTQMGDIGFGIKPMIESKTCEKCGWAN